jgi:hypothetical protein
MARTKATARVLVRGTKTTVRAQRVRKSYKHPLLSRAEYRRGTIAHRRVVEAMRKSSRGGHNVPVEVLINTLNVDDARTVLLQLSEQDASTREQIVALASSSSSSSPQLWSRLKLFKQKLSSAVQYAERAANGDLPEHKLRLATRNEARVRCCRRVFNDVQRMRHVTPPLKLAMLASLITVVAYYDDEVRAYEEFDENLVKDLDNAAVATVEQIAASDYKPGANQELDDVLGLTVDAFDVSAFDKPKEYGMFECVTSLNTGLKANELLGRLLDDGTDENEEEKVSSSSSSSSSKSSECEEVIIDDE